MDANTHFSSGEATAALTAIAQDYMTKCQGWLLQYEPGYAAQRGPEAVIDAAIQGALNAQVQTDSAATPILHALAHAMAKTAVQHPKGWAVAVPMFADLLAAKCREIEADMQPLGRA